MRKHLLPIALLAALPLGALAADGDTKADADNNGDWSGSGEAGFAAARGNAKSENLNAKFQFKKEDETWKDDFYLTALRAKGEVNTTTVENGVAVNTSSTNSTRTATKRARPPATSSTNAATSSARCATKTTISRRSTTRPSRRSATATPR